MATISALDELGNAKPRPNRSHALGMYNVLDKLRHGEALSAKGKTLHEHVLVSVRHTLHKELNAAVLSAYVWQDLARVAGTDTLLQRLVDLDTRRAAEEATGTIRWLRAEFQNSNVLAAPVESTPTLQQTDMGFKPTDISIATSARGFAADLPDDGDEEETRASLAFSESNQPSNKLGLLRCPNKSKLWPRSSATLPLPGPRHHRPPLQSPGSLARMPPRDSGHAGGEWAGVIVE